MPLDGEPGLGVGQVRADGGGDASDDRPTGWRRRVGGVAAWVMFVCLFGSGVLHLLATAAWGRDGAVSGGGSELVTALRAAYSMDLPFALRVVLLIGLWQGVLGCLWLLPGARWVAGVFTVGFLAVGAAPIGYLLLADIRVGCGCGVKPAQLSVWQFNVLSLVKNVVLAMLAWLAVRWSVCVDLGRGV